ncbi:MAG: hypothetical protein H0X25_04670 [Acidobacteriales bacterium]|nr:hypothetical protein [Terriglobales bacterium]
MSSKSTSLLVVALSLLATFAQAQAPSLWNAKVDSLGNFVMQNTFPLESDVISNFTPDTAITVTRLQLQAAGSYINGGANNLSSCAKVPAIQITDGNKKYALAIPNASIQYNQHNEQYAGSVSNDSGPIRLSFPPGALLTLRALAGDKGCSPYEINITVQYH